MVAAFGIGPDTAAELLIVAGDNIDRVRSRPPLPRRLGRPPTTDTHRDACASLTHPHTSTTQPASSASPPAYRRDEGLVGVEKSGSHKRPSPSPSRTSSPVGDIGRQRDRSSGETTWHGGIAARSLDSSSEPNCPHDGRTHDSGVLPQAAGPYVSPIRAAVPGNQVLTVVVHSDVSAGVATTAMDLYALTRFQEQGRRSYFVSQQRRHRG